jgi:hypothetical protein
MNKEIKDENGREILIGGRVGVYDVLLCNAIRAQTLKAYHEGETYPYETEEGDRYRYAIKDHAAEMDGFPSVSLLNVNKQ